MTGARFGKPSDRSSRRQVVAYLPVKDADNVRSRAAAAGQTLQEVIAKAINGKLAAMGVPPVLNEIKLAHFVRKSSAAATRIKEGHRPARMGSKIVAGWFDRTEVRQLQALTAEFGLSSQILIEGGLDIMGYRVEPVSADLQADNRAGEEEFDLGDVAISSRLLKLLSEAT